MNDEWRTPLDLFKVVDEEFHFDFDLCTNLENTQVPNCTNNIELFIEAMEYDSGYSTYWMNPPYSRGNIDMCMEQAVKLFKRGRTVVCLIRMDPSTKWFQQYVDNVASEVRMLDKRVKFQGADSAYNFPCCLVVYDPAHHPGMNPIALSTEYTIWGW